MVKYLLLIPSLTLSLLFSAGSWAEWTKVSEGASGSSTTYVDFDRIRKVNGLVYYWSLVDYLEPTKQGDMSFKDHIKADCELMRSMGLSYSSYSLPMAEGTAESTFTPDPKWHYAQPNSVLEDTLQAVCAH